MIDISVLGIVRKRNDKVSDKFEKLTDKLLVPSNVQNKYVQELIFNEIIDLIKKEEMM